MTPRRVGIVGAGIIGLAVARQLVQTQADIEVTVLEKESVIGSHQTGHNSGVAHAGVYYAPGSLKAELCRAGVAMLRDFCREKGLAYEEVGKTIIAVDRDELQGLREIEARARANGVPGIRWLEGSELRDVEPNVAGVAGLHSPTTAIVDFKAVADCLAEDVIAAGGAVRLGAAVRTIRASREEVEVVAGADSFIFDRLIVCGGLQTDRLARLAGDTRGPAIVPFRGEYYRLAPERESLVSGLVYPVPDPTYPFLGVHFTPRVTGGVDVGPNAVLALAREGYRRRDASLADVWELLSWRGFRALARHHWRAGVHEARGSLSKRAFTARARRYFPDLTPADLVPAPAGVRAQAVDADGALVDDFRMSRIGPVIAIRNAPSPGATSSLAIARQIVEVVLADGPTPPAKRAHAILDLDSALD